MTLTIQLADKKVQYSDDCGIVAFGIQIPTVQFKQKLPTYNLIDVKWFVAGTEMYLEG